MKRLVIVPAFNEARAIGRVIASIKKILPQTSILVVDDGSSDATNKSAEKSGAIVIRHPVNRGLGGAIGTGLAYAKRHTFEAAVTFDADGQHEAKDLQTAFKMLGVQKYDVVIGNRMHGNNVIPFDRVLINIMANIFTFLLFGRWTNDSQSGFRGFGKKAIERLEIKTDRMEVSSEIFSEIARLGLRFGEMPIRVRYTTYSRTKGQQNSNVVPVLSRLVLRLFR